MEILSDSEKRRLEKYDIAEWSLSYRAQIFVLEHYKGDAIFTEEDGFICEGNRRGVEKKLNILYKRKFRELIDAAIKEHEGGAEK